MERLTKPLCGGYELPMIPMEIKTQDDLQKFHEARKFYESCAIRCGQYEDTGLEPQDVISAVDIAKIACALHELNAYKDLGSINHLRDLIQAEQDGRLVVLPCKVVCGTTIWWADSSIHTDPIKCEVSSFGIYTGSDGGLQLWMNCYVYGSTPTSRSFRMSSIGKTVFLTREAAEAALKGGEG